MGNFSFGQLIILFLLFLLVFGDFSKMLANLKTILKKQKRTITKRKNTDILCIQRLKFKLKKLVKN